MFNRRIMLVLIVVVLMGLLCYYVVIKRNETAAKVHIVQVTYAGLELPKERELTLETTQEKVGEEMPSELSGGGLLGTMESSSSNGTLVRVAGSASLEVVPDLLILRISVSATGRTAEEAVKNASEIVGKVLDKLKDLGVSEDSIETDYYHLVTVYDYEVKPPKVVGYRVIHVLKVEIRSKEMAASIIDEVSKFTIERIIISSSLSTEKYKETYLKALEQALSDALNKAKIVAEALSMKIERVREVYESTSYGVIRYAKVPETVVAGTRTTEIYPEKVSVKCTVTMVVELVKD